MIVSATLDITGAVKADKNLDQAASLIVAHDLARRGNFIDEAWMEAWDSGPNWREALATGAMRLDPNALQLLHRHVSLMSSEHGFASDSDPLKSMAAVVAAAKKKT